MYKITDPKFVRLVEGGVPLVELEQRLKPGNFSTVGFLGSNERLIEIVHADWKILEKQGVTHEQIASAIYSNQFGNGYELLPILTTISAQPCPWGCGNMSRNTGYLIESGLSSELKEGLMTLTTFDFDLKKLEAFLSRSSQLKAMFKNVKNYVEENRARILITGLLPHMIGTHYFFEGRETPYRADPKILSKALKLGGK